MEKQDCRMKKISLFLMVAAICAAIFSVGTPAQADPPYPVPCKVVTDSAWVRDAPRPHAAWVATAYRDNPFIVTKSTDSEGGNWSYGSLWRNGSVVAYGWIPTANLRPV
jgi:hypothetical protein